MRIFKTSINIILLALGVYTIFFVIFDTVRRQKTPHANLPYIDTYWAKKDPCIRHDAQATIWFKSRISNNNNPKIIILGGSSARDGFRPEEIKKHFPDHEIHNLAFSGSNISQMLQVVSFLKETSAREAFKNTIFIYGGVSGSFFSNKTRQWTDNGGPFPAQIDFSKEYDLNKNGKYQAVFSNAVSETMITLHFPLVCLSSTLKHYKEKPQEIWDNFRRRDEESEDKSEIASVSNQINKKNRRQKNKFDMKNRSFLEQIDELYVLNTLIKSMGAELIFVQAPMAPWFMNDREEYQVFETIIDRIYQEKVIKIISINKGFTDDMFRDHGHPVMNTTYLWAQNLSKKL